MLADFPGAKALISGPAARLSKRLKDRFLYLTPRYLRYLGQTVVVTPWLIGIFSLFLLAFVPQIQELYIGVIEDRDFVRGALGLASLSAFSALLYYWNHQEVTKCIDGIYPDHADIYFDRGVAGIRDLKTAIASSLPFAGLSIGLLAARSRVLSASAQVEAVSGALGGGLDRAEPLQARLSALPAAILLCIALTLAVFIALSIGLHRSRNNMRWRRRFYRACYALTALFIAVPIVASSTALQGARLAGPLANIGFVLISGAIFLRVLIWIVAQIVWAVLTLPSVMLLSLRRMLAPAQFTIAAILFIAVAFVGMKLAQPSIVEESQRRAPLLEALRERSGNTGERRAKLTQTFANWLKARETGGGEYPVFIVTAEGGGIYAASAVSFFLAGMQERCPDFAEHVFAISAVSGGSIGASLFNAALSEKSKGKDVSRVGGAPAGCIEPASHGELFERLREVTRDDYLSPVLAYILPDIVRNIRELLAGPAIRKEPCKNEARFEWFGRDQILEKSFIASFSRSKKPDGGFAAVCPGAADAGMLMRNFSDAWTPGAKLPAPLLNATWVETGYRVAFSPFPLRHLGEGTLYSFGDVGELPGIGHEAGRSWQDPSLIGAAVVSARFPFLMPPWATNPNSKNRWTFVDGGYADSSGVTTGLELYLELKRQWASAPELKGLAGANGKEIRSDQIKFYLISLTDAYAEPDYRKIAGGSLGDFISPINTLLTVRELLAMRAVTGAYAQLGGKMITIQLDQQTFPLPLGWKISALSSDIVRFTMGRPANCDPARERDLDWAAWTVNHNSCELKNITALLTPPPAPPAPPPPPAAPPPVQSPGSWLPLPR